MPPRALNLAAVAAFRTIESSGATVDARVDVRSTPISVRVGLALHRTERVCLAGTCRDQPTLSGVTFVDVAAADGNVDQFLRHGAVHATIRFHDDISLTDLPMRVDAVWSAAGPESCDSLDGSTGCARRASATASVSSGDRSFIRGQTVTEGQLSWHRIWS
jgi:hypothetical protein